MTGTPTEGRSAGSVALRPVSGTLGAESTMPVPPALARPGAPNGGGSVGQQGSGSEHALRRAATHAAVIGVTTALAVGATVSALIAITDRPHGHARPMPACELDDRAEGLEVCR